MSNFGVAGLDYITPARYCVMGVGSDFRLNR